MLVGEFVRKFSTVEMLPVDIDDHVEPAIRATGVKDEIYIFPDPKLNPGILRGEIKHWKFTHPDHSEDRRVADITYSEAQDHEWQRLVCCKELLHMLDPEDKRVANPDDIHRLVERIILPPDMQDPFVDGPKVVADRVAVIYAVAVLFPLACRTALLPDFTAGKRTLRQIADDTELPIRYVATVMSEIWPEIHQLLIS